MISFSHNFIFIHIPKTGGNSIQSVLAAYSEDEIVKTHGHQDGIERFEIKSSQGSLKKHSTLKEYRKLVGDSRRFEKFAKIAVVRNPWDRMISLYFSPHAKRNNWRREEFMEMVKVSNGMDFFVSHKKKYPWVSKNRYAEDAFSNLDQIIRFENIQSDFYNCMNSIGVPEEKLPIRNRSIRTEYHQYYDDVLINLVGEKFIGEINLFNYSY